MWFSPIKGHYPSLGQVDKTLPVKTGATDIERGTVLVVENDTVNADGVFNVAPDATKPGLLYIALQDYEDSQAGMAGTVPYDGANATLTGVTAGVPSITGLSLSQEGEYETDRFTGLDSAEIGAGLTVKNGMFTAAADDAIVVAYLTGKPTMRWVNNAPAKKAGNAVVRQGANVSVIRFATK